MHNIFDEKWPGKFELVDVVNFEENVLSMRPSKVSHSY
jgi:hypothetical protein